MAAISHIGTVWGSFGPHMKGTWWSCHCAKFGCNRCSSFKNM